MSLRMLMLAAAAVAGLAFPVAAQAAYTTGSVNVRTGPSTGYGVITTLPPGAYVGVSRCTSGWCLVSASGVSGWISARYIDGGQPRTYYAPPPPRYYAPAYPTYVYPRYVYPRYAYPRYAYPRRNYYGAPGYGLYGGGPGYGFYFNFGSSHHWH